MKKTLKVILLAVILISIASSVMAYSNDDLIAELTSSRTVAGKKVTLTADEIGAVKKQLNANPLSDEEAAAIKSKVDSIISIMDEAGTTDVTELSDADKEKVKSLAVSAGNIADVNISFNTGNKTFTVTNKDGKTLYKENYTTRKTMTYTGATNNVVYIVPVVAIVAVAMFVVIKKNK